MGEYNDPFEWDHFYNIYNHANGNEGLFPETKNYNFFLERYDKYLTNFVDIWSYCLLPNHFHFLMRVKDENSLAKVLKLGKACDEIISRGLCRTPYIIPIRPTIPVECHNVAPAGGIPRGWRRGISSDNTVCHR